MNKTLATAVTGIAVAVGGFLAPASASAAPRVHALPACYVQSAIHSNAGFIIGREIFRCNRLFPLRSARVDVQKWSKRASGRGAYAWRSVPTTGTPGAPKQVGPRTVRSLDLEALFNAHTRSGRINHGSYRAVASITAISGKSAISITGTLRL